MNSEFENEDKERWRSNRCAHCAGEISDDGTLAGKQLPCPHCAHSSLQVTMDRYGHLFRDDDHKRAMDEIARGLVS